MRGGGQNAVKKRKEISGTLKIFLEQYKKFRDLRKLHGTLDNIQGTRENFRELKQKKGTT
jgi:F0F1-type ATP synthase alpha subunit